MKNGSTKSGHREIFEQMRRNILVGKYDGAGNLPSEKALARQFDVSRPTISRVMLDLKREGLIVTHQGAPTKLTRFARNATGALGIVVPGVCYAEIFRPIVNELKRVAERSGWCVLAEAIKSEKPTMRAQEARRIAHRLANERVAGVFFQPVEFVKDFTSASRDILAPFDRYEIPVLLLDYDIVKSPDRSIYDLVGIDNVGAGLSIGRHLIKKGSKKICFLLRPGAAPSVTDRLRGVALAALEADLVWSRKNNILKCEPENRRAVLRFVTAESPDAIVAGNDVAAAKLHETLTAINKAGSIRLAGFDDVAIARQLKLTTCRQPLDDLAHVAFQTLLQRIRSPAAPPRTILLHAPLVVR